MKNMKFRIESPEHSSAIQKELFRLGFKWSIKRIINTKEPYLYAYSYPYGKVLGFGTTERHFIEHENTETTLEELKLMNP